MGKFSKLARLAEIEYSNIVISTQDLGVKLRIYLKDKSFIDIFFTENVAKQKFSIHWERTHLDGYIYRIDNTPDNKWSSIKSFPIHFHLQSYENVTIPPFKLEEPVDLEDLLRNFLKFVHNVIK